MPTLDIRFADRPMTEADIPAVMAMEHQACLHPLHAWTHANYVSSLRVGYWSQVCCQPDTGQVLAACVAMDGVDELHLLNIVVDTRLHRQGVARQLLAMLYARCVARRSPMLWLEVRPSNTRARALYDHQGFEQVGVRKAYYPAPGGREDALVMCRRIDLGEAPHALD